MRAVAAINGDGPPVVTLDVFGPIEPSYEERFRRLVDSVPHVRYAGRVPPERAAAAVSGHFALIFPTEWTGEGVPGTIIDAMHAGLPVVASRWRYYHEMLQDGVTGLSYDFDRPELLEATIRELLALPDEELAAMRRATLERARAYAPEAVFGEIARALTRPARSARTAGEAGPAAAADGPDDPGGAGRGLLGPSPPVGTAGSRRLPGCPQPVDKCVSRVPFPPVSVRGGGKAGGPVRRFVPARPLQGGPPEFPDAAPQGFIEADALKNSGG